MPPQDIKKQNNIKLPITHNFTLFLIGVIVVGLVAFVSYTYLNLTVPAQELNQGISVKTDVAEGWKTYKNQKYGFELNFSDDWSGYKTKTTNDGIEFILPTKYDEGGVHSMFEIVTINKDLWEKGGMADSPSPKYIAERNGIVFAAWGTNNAPPDLANQYHRIDQILSTFKFTNNYDTFDPDGTLSDISVNQVFKNWLKSKKIGYEQFELGHFSSRDMIFNEGENVNYCSGADKSKIFISPNKDKEICFFSGEEPDSDLYLYEKDTNTTVRIGFCGTPCIYETGFWLSPNKFVFLWTFYDMEYENKNRPFKQYMIDMYDLDLSKVSSWSSKKVY